MNNYGSYSTGYGTSSTSQSGGYMPSDYSGGYSSGYNQGYSSEPAYSTGSVFQTAIAQQPSTFRTNDIGFGAHAIGYGAHAAAFSSSGFGQHTGAGFGSYGTTGFSNYMNRDYDSQESFDVSPWQSYDSRKRSNNDFEDNGGFRSGAKRPRKKKEKKPEVVFGRDVSFGTIKIEADTWLEDDALRRINNDDQDIPVNKTLIDQRFNFWNLNSNEKVLLVSNIPQTIANPRFLFNLFSFYGDIQKIQILPTKEDAAFMEFTTATDAMIARNHLDGFGLCDQQLVVSFAKCNQIQSPKDAQRKSLFMDFSGPEYIMMHRYSNESIRKVNLPHVCEPMENIYVSNVPSGKSPNEVASLFLESGLKVLSLNGYKFIPKKKKLIESVATGNAIKMCNVLFMSMATISDAALCVAFFNGKYSSLDLPEGLRVSFSKTQTESKKMTKSWIPVANTTNF